MHDYGITLQDVYQARGRIQGLVRHTYLQHSPWLSSHSGRRVWLKLENLQLTGSFKIRGAANTLLSLSAEQKERGVLAFSTGNHGRAVAYVAHQLGIRAVVCLSKRVPDYRVQAMEALGAEVVRSGESQDEASIKAAELEREEGLTMIKPFDDPLVIAGQGTIGLELLEDLPEVDTLLVPLSGGGLMAGVAYVAKQVNPGIRTIGLSLEVSAPMHESIQAGEPVEIDEVDSIGDALLGGIGLDNAYTFPLVRDMVDEILLLSEEEIADGLVSLFREHRLVAEGAGIVGVSALMHKQGLELGSRVAAVVSGGNMDPELLVQLCSQRFNQ